MKRLKYAVILLLGLSMVTTIISCQKDGGGSNNGHEYVDLGLPSGTLWATCNVGADTPEGYGDYFAWGETETKNTYKRDTYKYYDGTYTKYSDGDGLTTLQSDDDAATANWGRGWHTPTEGQWEELCQNTTTMLTTQNDVVGWLFTASNGNSIFLPAVGERVDDELINFGSGFYWSSSLFEIGDGFGFVFGSGCGVRDFSRYYGLSVRPVRSTH